MSADVTTRLLLLGILICLIALVVQGFSGSSMPTFGRYQVLGTRAGVPMLIRTDTETGKVWKLELRGGDDTWMLFAEGEEGAGQGEAAGTDALADTEPGASEPEIAAAEAPEPSLPDLTAPEPEPRAPQIKFKPKPPSSPPPPAPPPSAEEEVAMYEQAATREDLQPEMRIWAVRQLARLDVPASTEVLIEASRTQDPQVALAAVEALGRRQGEEVAAALEQAQAHADEAVRKAAQQALEGVH